MLPSPCPLSLSVAFGAGVNGVDTVTLRSHCLWDIVLLRRGRRQAMVALPPHLAHAEHIRLAQRALAPRYGCADLLLQLGHMVNLAALQQTQSALSTPAACLALSARCQAALATLDECVLASSDDTCAVSVI
jgi:hypothetical protein